MPCSLHLLSTIPLSLAFQFNLASPMHVCCHINHPWTPSLAPSLPPSVPLFPPPFPRRLSRHVSLCRPCVARRLASWAPGSRALLCRQRLLRLLPQPHLPRLLLLLPLPGWPACLPYLLLVAGVAGVVVAAGVAARRVRVGAQGLGVRAAREGGIARRLSGASALPLHLAGRAAGGEQSRRGEAPWKLLSGVR